ncbi:MAG TPA: SUF system NifU family Fe-S cluster assembly protein [Acidiphilium sp.]|uniref:Fe-S cluster assembly sulfur transfer protein SufU n=1 Tax=unclassified Acidiphilium TaxID=2617493 RepID=UPI000BCD5879|nr:MULTISPECIES: SUF system NifU family Fe-S cluster assembly protein [unclassified Acidiphilium]OYV55655.1 MAG: SUF system NifU family Fe-S cluster assembly protein [Acidiphilium sp. 20-67-58]OYV86013.1 MAG: SUF system NifU family Fe-S cluster assembly protein [Acidiphilium sp. 21-68-69]HQT61425.1 SUF system NifU family Fe-S cluster assembly protein [Acidiphilium sp.]HQU10166.1 SUF system NifU family Fe-S cluster assembly protein [Acidiphilium sp.]
MSDAADVGDLYQRLIMDRARAPLHAGRPAAFDAEAEGDNPMCGDRVQLRLSCSGGAIGEVWHETRGCAICIASADLMADAVTGRTRTAANELAGAFETMVASGAVPDREDFTELRALSGVHEYRSRHRCATLPWQALRAALTKTMETGHGG